MNLMTISEVTRTFNITTRMLRYYDEIGLLPSKRREDYAYRVYDDSDARRLQQIITLRKLRIPLKKIAVIVNDTEQSKIVEVFQESINEIDEEITALQTIREILHMFVIKLNSSSKTKIKINMLEDDEVISVIQTLSLSKINFKEDRSMDDLRKANETLSTLKNVRIIYLPPATVASSHFIGSNPEDNAGIPFDDFIRNSGLAKIKPDLRVYGFNNPCPKGDETYGYEFWVTIPDDMNVPSPLKKKKFKGGLYAAHCIKMGDFHEWQLLSKWVHENGEYVYEAREPLGMDGSIEEHLNAYSYYTCDKETANFIQLDLLIPVRVN